MPVKIKSLVQNDSQPQRDEMRRKKKKTALPTAMKASSATPHKTPFIVIQGAARSYDQFIIHN